MLTWRFAPSVVELVGLVIEKTEVVYLKPFPYVVVKKTFQVICGVASFQTQKMKLILFCRVPTSLRRHKISMILQIAPLIDQISVFEWSRSSSSKCRVPKEVSGHGKVGLSRFQKPIGELAGLYHRSNSRCLENSYNLAPVSRLVTTVSKITRDVRLKSRLRIGQ